jgi:hypothetical protein
LGVNGDAFLLYIAGRISKNGAKGSATRPRIVAAEDLPVEGNANVTMQTPSPTVITTASKPWWWYPSLMPLWVKIASAGSDGMKQRLAEYGYSHDLEPHPDDPEETIGPCKRDYYISIFFICFGVLAAVVGIISNVYVEIIPNSSLDLVF